jgi:hypothetical protein
LIQRKVPEIYQRFQTQFKKVRFGQNFENFESLKVHGAHFEARKGFSFVFVHFSATLSSAEPYEFLVENYVILLGETNYVIVTC